MKRIVNELAKLNWGKMVYAVFVLCAATAVVLPARTFTTLHSFDGTDGGQPRAGLVQATNGDFYGTTAYGPNCPGVGPGCGTVFKITPNGALTTLYSFGSQSGGGTNPTAGLVQASNGDFYGTTLNGGAGGNGTVFKITPSATLTTLYSFCSQPNCTEIG